MLLILGFLASCFGCFVLLGMAMKSAGILTVHQPDYLLAAVQGVLMAGSGAIGVLCALALGEETP